MPPGYRAYKTSCVTCRSPLNTSVVVCPNAAHQEPDGALQADCQIHANGAKEKECEFHELDCHDLTLIYEKCDWKITSVILHETPQVCQMLPMSKFDSKAKWADIIDTSSEPAEQILSMSRNWADLSENADDENDDEYRRLAVNAT